MHLSGDVLETGETYELNVRVLGAAGQVLRVIADGRVAYERPVDADDWTHAQPMPPARRYVRAEIVLPVQMFGQDRWVMCALSNPFFF